MVVLILWIPSHYIIKAHIGDPPHLTLRCLMVAMEEDGTHDTLDAQGTQVIHAIEDIEDVDPITHGGHITNGIW